MFLSLDGTFWVQLINFAIFFAILNVVFLRPVGKAIRERREYINSLTHDYERYQAEAMALQKQAESLRAAARREAEHTIAKARAEASDEAARVSAEYARQAAHANEAAERTVEEELRAARAHEEQRVRELAELMLERTMLEASA